MITNISDLSNKIWAVDDSTARALIAQYIDAQQGTIDKTFAQKRAFLERAACGLSQAVEYGDVEIKDGVCIIPIRGSMAKSDGWCNYGTATVAGWVQEADRSIDVRQIVVVIDSGGGTVDGTQSLYRAVKDTQKPITAIVDGYACSAAYWVASGADRIVATSQTDTVGSIGVMTTIIDYTKQLEERGIKLSEIYAKGSEDKNAEFKPDSKGDYPILRERLTALRVIFVSDITTSRPQIKEECLTGKTYLADEAIQLGLIDGYL